MLQEVQNARQIPGERPRRWFSDDDMDLIVWLGADESVEGFQLAYRDLQSEHALTWMSMSGFRHDRIDNGEGKPGNYKGTPILVPDGEYSALEVADLFKEKSQGIDTEVSKFVYERLIEHAEDVQENRSQTVS